MPVRFRLGNRLFANRGSARNSGAAAVAGEKGAEPRLARIVAAAVRAEIYDPDG